MSEMSVRKLILKKLIDDRGLDPDDAEDVLFEFEISDESKEFGDLLDHSVKEVKQEDITAAFYAAENICEEMIQDGRLKDWERGTFSFEDC